MSEHQIYLNIGSNLRPEIHLPQAIDLLGKRGRIEAVSSAWESRAVGSAGPNFLNACVLFLTPLRNADIKEKVISPIEAILGRVRAPDKYVPRPIDIDIMMTDGKPARLEHWNSAFVIVPMAEINPDLQHPLTREKLSRAAERIRRQIWIRPRPDVLQHTRYGEHDS